ncbi:hypothetical protein [Vibrio aquimaris]|uniref:Uncharacterized protein n=1 Tax=Vibrio aquimaris TaxID=2587862 RepID=A0A5P9CPS8_9VIBR|nr:hypothetical protein [Vibrio aquimaris]QFT28204.1 hypothetical protein FIV01_17575 [Vibrio aquimaris]
MTIETNFALSASNVEGASSAVSTQVSPEAAKAATLKMAPLLSMLTDGKVTQVSDSLNEALVALYQNPSKENQKAVNNIINEYVPASVSIEKMADIAASYGKLMTDGLLSEVPGFKSFEPVTGEVTYTNSTGGSSTVSISDLLAMLLAIIEQEGRTRNSVMASNIDVGVANMDNAKVLAEKICDDAMLKLGIAIGIAVTTMVFSTAVMVNTAKPKTLKDKHLESGSVDNLKKTEAGRKLIDEKTAALQQAKTAKSNFLQQANQATGQASNQGTEMMAAQDKQQQDEIKAGNDLQMKLAEALPEFIKSLGDSLRKLLEVLEAAAKASLATNR